MDTCGDADDVGCDVSGNNALHKHTHRVLCEAIFCRLFSKLLVNFNMSYVCVLLEGCSSATTTTRVARQDARFNIGIVHQYTFQHVLRARAT